MMWPGNCGHRMTKDKLSVVIDGINIEVTEHATVMEVAQGAGIYIPALCYHPALKPLPESRPELACGLCVIDLDGVSGFPLACTTTVFEGMVVHTDTPEVRGLRCEKLKTILLEHPHACFTCDRAETCGPNDLCKANVPPSERCVTCPKNGRCELQNIVRHIGLDDSTLPYIPKGLAKGKREPLFDRDPNFCVLCGRCVRVCHDVLGVGAISFIQDDDRIVVGPTSGTSYKDSGCRFCGVCVELCPTAALMDQGERWLPFPDRRAALVPCTHNCPAGIDVSRYVHLIGAGRYDEAATVIKKRVPFPRVLGHVCTHPCEVKCRRGELNEPIAIRLLKRFALECSIGGAKPRVFLPTGKRVAIVGSGPAGLTAAYYLNRQGHSVTVFDEQPRPGGMMRIGIPEFRLPRDVLDADIGEICEAGVDIQMDQRIESLDDLWTQGFDVIFLAIGAHHELRMGIEGEDIPGVIGGISLLREVNLGTEVRIGNRVAVVGGGGTAIDVARVALRLGAGEVVLLYRRKKADMPAKPDEVEEAVREGIKLEFLVAPSRLHGDGGVVIMECARTKLGRPDASGRKSVEPITGSEFSLRFDTVIIAVGHTPRIPLGFSVQVENGYTLQVDIESLATSREGVFAGGDVVTGPASIVEAIAVGIRAAISIDKYLGGNGVIDEAFASCEKSDFWLGRREGFGDMSRISAPALPPEERRSSFAATELSLGKEAAIAEAQRCLQCELRLRLPP